MSIAIEISFFGFLFLFSNFYNFLFYALLLLFIITSTNYHYLNLQHLIHFPFERLIQLATAIGVRQTQVGNLGGSRPENIKK